MIIFLGALKFHALGLSEVPPKKHITGALLAGLILRGGYSVSKRSSCLAEVHAGDPGTLQ